MLSRHYMINKQAKNHSTEVNREMSHKLEASVATSDWKVKFFSVNLHMPWPISRTPATAAERFIATIPARRRIRVHYFQYLGHEMLHTHTLLHVQAHETDDLSYPS